MNTLQTFRFKFTLPGRRRTFRVTTRARSREEALRLARAYTWQQTGEMPTAVERDTTLFN